MTQDEERKVMQAADSSKKQNFTAAENNRSCFLKIMQTLSLMKPRLYLSEERAGRSWIQRVEWSALHARAFEGA
jgi:hypothetical protein